MAKNILKIKINSDQVVQLLQSHEVFADLRDRAERIEEALPVDNNEEWEIKSFKGKDRNQVVIKTANFEAMKAAANGPVLQTALGSGR